MWNQNFIIIGINHIFKIDFSPDDSKIIACGLGGYVILDVNNGIQLKSALNDRYGCKFSIKG